MDENKRKQASASAEALSSAMPSGEAEKKRELDDALWLSVSHPQCTVEASEKLARIQERLETFQQIAQTVGSDASIEMVLEIISDKTTQLMRAERTTIFLLEKGERGAYLSSKIAQGAHVIELELGQGIAGTVALRRKSMNLKDAYKSPLFEPSFDIASGFKTTSCLCFPIMNMQKDLLGVIQVLNKINGYFTLDDEEMIASICAQIGVSLTQHQFYMSMVLKNAELLEAHEKLRRHNEELDILYNLERDAALAPDLTGLIEMTLARCMRVFRTRYAAILLMDGTQNRLYQMTQSLGAAPLLEVRTMEKPPPFLPSVIRHDDCVVLNCDDIPSLPEQTSEYLGQAQRTLLVVQLSHLDALFGALILGTKDDYIESKYTPSATKLALLLAANLMTTIAVHIEREASEKNQRLTAIGQMMSSLLHDMKTPLANISGYVDLMVNQPDDHRRQTFATTVEKQIGMLKNMGFEILQYARGETTLLTRKTTLHSIVEQAVELLKPEAAKRKIALVCNEHYRGYLTCDELKIQRVIVNLAKNAMEAIDHDGQIQISTHADDQYVYLVIQDDGPGIPPELSDTLFDAFVTYGKRSGTGLGLSIVKKIVEEHGASISWKPAQPHGTKFVIRFRLDAS
ncbi:MAG: GAF domain-containing sensor histidine kinase [Proteobacteria bacterium]|nr:GAF domain-containing sensor histidine kinase [Pseudomonadota bacterium]